MRRARSSLTRLKPLLGPFARARVPHKHKCTLAFALARVCIAKCSLCPMTVPPRANNARGTRLHPIRANCCNPFVARVRRQSGPRASPRAFSLIEHSNCVVLSGASAVNTMAQYSCKTKIVRCFKKNFLFDFRLAN